MAGVDGLHLRLALEFLEDPRWLALSLASRAVVAHVMALGLKHRREFLPRQYTAGTLCRALWCECADIEECLREILGAEEPILGQLSDGRLRAIGVRQKHGLRFHWKDESEAAVMWNEGSSSDAVDVAAFGEVLVKGRPRVASREERAPKARQTSGKRTLSGRSGVVSRTPAKPETLSPVVEEEPQSQEEPQEEGHLAAASPNGRSEAAAVADKRVDGQRSPAEPSPPLARPEGANDGDGPGKDPEDPPGWEAFLKSTEGWNGHDAAFYRAGVLARARTLGSTFDGMRFVLGHYYDACKLARPWKGLARRLSDDGTRSPSAKGRMFALGSVPRRTDRQGSDPPVHFAEAARGALGGLGFKLPGEGSETKGGAA